MQPGDAILTPGWHRQKYLPHLCAPPQLSRHQIDGNFGGSVEHSLPEILTDPLILSSLPLSLLSSLALSDPSTCSELLLTLPPQDVSSTLRWVHSLHFQVRSFQVYFSKSPFSPEYQTHVFNCVLPTLNSIWPKLNSLSTSHTYPSYCTLRIS